MTNSRDLPRRTILAVPGSSDRFIDKARTLGVDGLFLDLEDAVAPAVKVESRRRIVDALLAPAGFTARLVTVRVNGWESPWTYGDVIEVVTGAGAMIDALVLPKTTSAAQVKALDLLLTQVEHNAGLEVGRIGLEVQIEDAVGLLHVAEIAAASPRLASLVFGPGDFMASLGMGGLNVGAQPDGYPADAFHHVLMSILVAARAHGLQAIDGPFVAIRDVDGFRRSAQLSAALGYDGKWVLHPAQVDAGNEVFSPKTSDFERAQRIMSSYAQAIGQGHGSVGAIVVDDEMVDEAGVKLAAAILARGRAAGMEVSS
ncbi:citrate lyase subunit beta/citryl-CoA lyase [Propionicimonas paludicola]|uniref:Citrate lyase subunit beta/citryl-CoA lyase n=1 Tax=Propionicimonas paludicola TaxID=185243 RepID=A0A2A9CUG6_9ACTN|nr:CoA ester lyase [Propionicimonas paludicola]PFG17292.1 citrate lyase subunit beta/citryl-CoA lyase [Propionicimonas paludicola]